MTYTRNKMNFSLLSSRQILFAAFFMFFVSLSVISVAGTVTLPKTGQTTCYDESGTEITCTGTGQDGDIQEGATWPDPRFTDNGDSTMMDELTGLMWLKDNNILYTDYPELNVSYMGGSGVGWTQALAYVAGMNAGTYNNFGHTDWRLPNINELESLINAEGNSGTWLNDEGFKNEMWGFWSSTSTTSQNLFLYMGSGYVNDSGFMNRTYWVWPVRTGSGGSLVVKTGQTASYATGDDGDIQEGVAWPSTRFTDKEDGTVKDELTGLVWTQNANLIKTDSPSFDEDSSNYGSVGDGSVTWQHALDYVAGMNDGTYPNLGYTDWRLPNRKELLSLIDYSQSFPALPVDHPFTNASSYYWSSTNYYGNAWYVPMGTGFVTNDAKTSNYYVWPVRTGGVTVSPSSHNFGNVTVGDTSTAQSFTLSNNSDADLVIGTISLTGADLSAFDIQNDLCSGQTVAVSGSCTVEAVFSPTGDAAASADLSIPTSDPDTPTLDVPLSGSVTVSIDIKANNSDGPVDISVGDQCSITISLGPGSYSGTSADWYIVVGTSSGWQSFNLSQMDYSTSGLSPLLQNFGLITLGPTAIFSTSSLSAGTYTYYFAVSLSGKFYLDSVVVNVQ